MPTGGRRKWRLPEQRSDATSRLEQVVLPHLDAAYTLARYLLRDAADAEDAVQDAVLRAIRHLHTLRDDASARAWLLSIVRRECYSLRDRRDDSALTTSLLDAAPEPRSHLQLVDPASSPEQDAQRSLVRRKLVEAMDMLTLPLREAIVLRDLQQLSYEEIATITDVPIGTVMSRLSRARARLASALDGLLDASDAS